MAIKVLVTGSNGQLGMTLREFFESDPEAFDVHFVDRDELDISELKKVSRLFAEKELDYCINCAAYTNVEQAEDDYETALRINKTGVAHLAECCTSNNVRLIHISTDYVFDGNSQSPYKETDNPAPLNKYGTSKLLGEEEILKRMTEFYIIRTSWLYSKYGNNFYKSIVRKIKANEQLNVVGNQIGSPTSCLELSEFILEIIRRTPEFGIYNFSSFGETSWYGFAREIATYFSDYSSEMIRETGSYKSKAKRPRYSVLNLDKTSDFYGGLIDWKSALERVVRSSGNIA